ncbi:hypothetical protein SAMN05880590_11928 [Rhizobium sp. RU35A]|uniref:hypothetical protein n=1 Tax=Rhizobium sp. RU35A TaxID=1907414 RepID=UPI00095543CA|nr:hypothetical protein [Rhizobium sp. RU35A]SIR35701.1 hypothetical protein SAMN05880590_11928 [Rhizobium sp. RU35A]
MLDRPPANCVDLEGPDRLCKRRNNGETSRRFESLDLGPAAFKLLRPSWGDFFAFALAASIVLAKVALVAVKRSEFADHRFEFLQG